mmetsp:Transcript_8596/g.28653  ORF Transcript_8596/g.28653 Transcript_8596/m.28653 type:complete len:279 (-) Transcript_8596:1004-1840(-)
MAKGFGSTSAGILEKSATFELPHVWKPTFGRMPEPYKKHSTNNDSKTSVKNIDHEFYFTRKSWPSPTAKEEANPMTRSRSAMGHAYVQFRKSFETVGLRGRSVGTRIARTKKSSELNEASKRRVGGSVDAMSQISSSFFSRSFGVWEYQDEVYEPVILPVEDPMQADARWSNVSRPATSQSNASSRASSFNRRREAIAVNEHPFEQMLKVVPYYQTGTLVGSQTRRDTQQHVASMNHSTLSKSIRLSAKVEFDNQRFRSHKLSRSNLSPVVIPLQPRS